MKDLKEVYPEYYKEEQKDGSFYGPGDYYTLIESMEYPILLNIDEKDYQGDSWYLFQKGGQYGYLNFGWGSCSGCDSLQACDSMQDIENLRTSLNNEIIWKNKEDMVKHLLARDEGNDYSYEKEEKKQFIEKAIVILNKGN